MRREIRKVVVCIHELMQSFDAVQLMEDVECTDIVAGAWDANANVFAAVVFIIFRLYTDVLA